MAETATIEQLFYGGASISNGIILLENKTTTPSATQNNFVGLYGKDNTIKYIDSAGNEIANSAFTVQSENTDVGENPNIINFRSFNVTSQAPGTLNIDYSTPFFQGVCTDSSTDYNVNTYTKVAWSNVHFDDDLYFTLDNVANTDLQINTQGIYNVKASLAFTSKTNNLSLVTKFFVNDQPIAGSGVGTMNKKSGQTQAVFAFQRNVQMGVSDVLSVRVKREGVGGKEATLVSGESILIVELRKRL